MKLMSFTLLLTLSATALHASPSCGDNGPVSGNKLSCSVRYRQTPGGKIKSKEFTAERVNGWQIISGQVADYQLKVSERDRSGYVFEPCAPYSLELKGPVSSQMFLHENQSIHIQPNRGGSLAPFVSVVCNTLLPE